MKILRPDRMSSPPPSRTEIVMGTPAETAIDIRPFQVETPEEELAELAPDRGDALAHQGARRRSVAGRAAGDAAGARPLLDDRVRLAQVRGETERVAAVHDRDRRGGHPLHPRQVTARERVAADHDARLARLGRSSCSRRSARSPTRPRTAARAEDAFHLVLPSLPGYGFSGEPTEVGWDPGRVARAWAELMRRLGYTRYVAQGGDVGAIVTDAMGRQAPEGLLGIHTELARDGAGGPDQLPAESEEERAALDALATFRATGFGYFLEQATRPQTIGYALLDSPVALAAWMLDHDTDSYYKISRAFLDGEPVGQSHPGPHRRQHHAVLADGHRGLGGPVRTGRADEPQLVRPARLLRRSRSRSASPRSPARSSGPRAAGSRRSTPNLTYFNEVDKGGHFAAWEEPELFAAEVRAAFSSLR